MVRVVFWDGIILFMRKLKKGKLVMKLKFRCYNNQIIRNSFRMILSSFKKSKGKNIISISYIGGSLRKWLQPTFSKYQRDRAVRRLIIPKWCIMRKKWVWLLFWRGCRQLILLNIVLVKKQTSLTTSNKWTSVSFYLLTKDSTKWGKR